MAAKMVTMTVLAAALQLLALSGAYAGYITKQDMAPVFSIEPPFNDANFITIDWLAPTVTIYSDQLLNIDNMIDEEALFDLPGRMVFGRIDNGPIVQVTLPTSLGTNPVVDVFFVDHIGFCGGPDGAGCASGIPNVEPPPSGKYSLAVESAAASGPDGVQLEAHELGHDLGLSHCILGPAYLPPGTPTPTPPTLPDPTCPAPEENASGTAYKLYGGSYNYPDLMNSFLNGSTDLTVAQVDLILSNPAGLIRTDDTDTFCQRSGAAPTCNYVLLQAIAVQPAPEPSAAVILGSSLILLGTLRRRFWPRSS